MECKGDKHTVSDHLQATRSEESNRTAIEAPTFFVGTDQILRGARTTLDFLPLVSLAIVGLALVFYGVADTSQPTRQQLT